MARYAKINDGKDRRRKLERLFRDLTHAVSVLGDRKKAIDLAQRLWALKPDDPNMLERLASIYVDHELEKETAEVIDYLEEISTPTPYRMMLRARLYFIQKNTHAALELCERALEMNPDIVTKMLLHNQIGQIYRNIADTTNAMKYYALNAKMPDDAVKDSSQAQKIRREDYDNYLFNIHNTPATREEIFEETRGYNRLLEHIPRYKHDRSKHAKHERIRVGYISGDIRYHVVAFFSMHLFMSYDKTKFDVYLYANNAADDISLRFRQNVVAFRQIIGKHAKEVSYAPQKGKLIE